jgi:hypothetical protein
MGLSRHQQKRLLLDRINNPTGMQAKDYRAKREGKAIDTMHIIGPVQARRLRLSHGEKHRSIG